jgi:phage gpG-like protein
MGINLDRFSRRERINAGLFYCLKKWKKNNTSIIDFRQQLVIRYTTLRNDSLLNFMQEHRPSYKWLRKNITEEDIKYYINDRLKYISKKQHPKENK